MGYSRHLVSSAGMAAATPGAEIQRIGRWILVAASLSLLLVGCSSEDNQDLHNYLSIIKARSAGRIEPIPEFKSYESFVYTAEKMRDPFNRYGQASDQRVVATATGPRPDVHRNKEALEAFPLDTLKFVGHLERGTSRWAIVTDPDGLVHRVQVGNYVGQNHGKIVKIDEVRIHISELVPNGLGGWIERKAKLAAEG